MTNLAVLFNYLAKLIIVLGIGIGIFLSVSDVQAQQGGAVTYGYDANGRLISVTLPTGESVTYSYDPAGNITGIQRLTGPGPQFFSFTPLFGFVGDTVTFTGNNFGSITSISFNGTNATVFSGNLTQITATVPGGASTGQIIVTLSNGTFTTSTFSVLAIQVTPSLASVLPNQAQQFNAIVPSQLGNTSVIWSVNGINGGNSTVGTISSTGLYIAPNITTNQTFTVKATSVARPTAFAQATVNVRPDLFVARSAAVSINKGLINKVFIAGLSVKKGDVLASTFSIDARASAVSVKKGEFEPSLNPLPTLSSAVSVTNSLVISSISQNSFARSSTTNITINGSNLEPTTALRFINVSTGTLDTSITATNIVVNQNGTSLTATITVPSTTSLGTKVIVATDNISLSSAGSSNGNNTIQLIP